MRATCITAVLALALAGCASSNAAAPHAPATSTPAPTPTPTGPAALGATQVRVSGDITVAATVYRVRSVKSRADIAEPSHRFLGAEVRVCVTKATAGAVSLSQGPWAIDYKDDTEVQPIGEWWDGEFSVPLYPADRKVVAGQCARGWVMFKPFKGKAVQVTYAPGEGQPAFWRIP